MKRFMYLFISAVFCTACCFAGLTAWADEKPETIVLLGDSITEGYGLSDTEHDYGYYLEKYYGAEVRNYAVSGHTTDDLLERLDEDEVRDSLKDAQLVCISIGGNDLLCVIEGALRDDDAFRDENGVFDTTKLSPGNLIDYFKKYASQLTPAEGKACENIKAVRSELKSLAPDAKIVMQTIYDPFKPSDPAMALMMKPVSTLCTTHIKKINETIRSLCDNEADIYLKFSEKPYLYTNIDRFDFHPNAVGHFLIAEEIIETLGIEGDMDALRDEINSLPYGTFSEFPEHLKTELDEIAQGELRRGSLETVMQRADSKEENTESTSTLEHSSGNNTDSNSNDSTDSSEAQTNAKKNKSSDSGQTKHILSKVFMIAGFVLIILVTARRIIKKRSRK